VCQKKGIAALKTYYIVRNKENVKIILDKKEEGLT